MLMNMAPQSLPPSVQHFDDPDLTSILPLGRLRQYIADAAKVQFVEDFLMSRDDTIEFVWQGEDDMQVIAVEAPPDQPISPLPPLEPIASRAMTIATRTHRQRCMIALRAVECRSTKPTGAATGDASHDTVEQFFFCGRRFRCPPIPPQNLSNGRWGLEWYRGDGTRIHIDGRGRPRSFRLPSPSIKPMLATRLSRHRPVFCHDRRFFARRRLDWGRGAGGEGEERVVIYR